MHHADPDPELQPLAKEFSWSPAVVQHHSDFARLEAEFQQLLKIWGLDFPGRIKLFAELAKKHPELKEIFEQELIFLTEAMHTTFRLSVNGPFGIFTRPALDETFLKADIHKIYFPKVAVCWDFDGMKRLNGLCGKAEVNKLVKFFLDWFRGHLPMTIYAYHSGDEHMGFVDIIPGRSLKSTLLQVRLVIQQFEKFLRSQKARFQLRLKKKPSKKYKLRRSERRKRVISVRPRATFYAAIVYGAKSKDKIKLFENSEAYIEAEKKRKRRLARKAKRQRVELSKETKRIHLAKPAIKKVPISSHKAIRLAA